MKIKTLLVSVLAVCAIMLSSCGKDKNYADAFEGTYSMVMTPSISVSVAGVEQETPIEAIEGIKCTIKETVPNTVSVTLMDEDNTPLFIFAGTCDETGMHLKSYTINQELDLGEDYGDIDLNITFGSATASEPVNGSIAWTTTLSGTIGMEMEVTPGFSMPVEAELAGNMAFSGIKQ